jgi:hypothetical protein
MGLSALICLAALAQDNQPAAVGGGHLPAHGPALAKAGEPMRVPASAPGRRSGARSSNFIAEDEKGHPNVPHVDARDDQWVGHNIAADDPVYHLDHLWAHGRFTGGFGPQHLFALAFDKMDPVTGQWLSEGLNRLSFGGFYWNIAGYDYNVAALWKWAGDQVAIYQDPVHIGWYLAYNPRVGSFAHVEYLGKVVKGISGPATDQTEMKGTFENDQVIIGQAHPKMHVHPYNRVMIYGTAGGEWLHFVDGHTQDLKWQAGEVKWSPVEKPHYSEIPPGANEGTRGPAGLDIGIKKPGVPGTVARTALDPLRVDPKDFKLEFENPQVRVLRLTLGPRQSVPMHEYVLNRIVYCYTDQNVRETSPEGKAEVKQHKAGEWVWEGGPRRQKVDNLNDKPYEAIVVEVRN